MAVRPRLLPIVICAAAGLLATKLVDLGSAALAATGQAAPPASDASGPAPSPQAAPPVPAAAPAKNAAQPQAAAPPAALPPRRDPLQMSPQEVSELQQLSQRRVQLDKRAADLSEREVLMSAAEKRVDEKIGKLEKLKQEIEADVKARHDEEDKRIESLGHMYEQMKPQDAARILDELDTPVVVTMLTHIRERNAAPILAAMDPAKAKAVTLALTEQKNAPPAATTAAAAAP